MTVLIKLFYAAAIAVLLVLLVAFGVRTFYAPPEMPQYPQPQIGFRPPIVAPVPAGVDPPVTPAPTPEQLALEAQQRQYQEDFERYQQRREDYRRNVFLIVAVVGLIAVAAGLALASSLDAIRLGLVAGGLSTVLYGVIQAGGDLAKAGPALVFVVAAVGLIAVIFAGRRWLTRVNEPQG